MILIVLFIFAVGFACGWLWRDIAAIEADTRRRLKRMGIDVDA